MVSCFLLVWVFFIEQTLQQQLISSTVMTLILLGEVRLYKQQKCFLHCVSFNTAP